MANKLAVAGPNSRFNLPDAKPAGFWAGFWHGMIVPITFVVSLFKPGVGIYETNNNGGWYNLGFILGASSSLGGTSTNIKVPGKKGEEADSDEAADQAEGE